MRVPKKSCHADWSEPGFPVTQHWTTQRVWAGLAEKSRFSKLALFLLRFIGHDAVSGSDLARKGGNVRAILGLGPEGRRLNRQPSPEGLGHQNGTMIRAP
jgi:hypothetical protein